ncbi:hypothetical protein [Rhodococcus sp. 14-2483-1-2]|uniref:hypothetical protein n=1 Tax=Rhodococcus sp. 14-2483-1-2 TaxID=2023147 RepID=UPI00113FC618|nr:hypothetical protein [Rhodococcus sp. 14-2483-1-2]
MTGKQALERGKKLRPDLVGRDTLDDADIGVIVGHTVQGNQKVFLSCEHMMFALAGPRMGNTRALAVMLCAPHARTLQTWRGRRDQPTIGRR